MGLAAAAAAAFFARFLAAPLVSESGSRCWGTWRSLRFDPAPTRRLRATESVQASSVQNLSQASFYGT